MMLELRHRPVFICGHPKSGTSLLRSLFDSHPQVITYPEETRFFRSYLPAAAGKALDEKLALADRMLTHVFDWNQTAPPPDQAGFLDRDYSHISAADIRGTMRDRIRECYRHDGDLLAAAVLAFGQVSGQLSPASACWVEKTPYNERFAGQIFAWWPEARCVHVVRDPRDNFVSYQRKHAEWSPESFGLSWARSTLAGLDHRDTYGSHRYWLMRYEDLVRDPGETIRALCDFLGIADDESLRQPARGGRPWQGNSMFTETFDQISRAPVGRWEGRLESDELVALEALAASPMRSLGYELRGDRVPLDGPARRRVVRRMVSLAVHETSLSPSERAAIEAASHFDRIRASRRPLPPTRGRLLAGLLLQYMRLLTPTHAH